MSRVDDDQVTVLSSVRRNVVDLYWCCTEESAMIHASNLPGPRLLARLLTRWRLRERRQLRLLS